jgi:hypothetical protein
MASIQWGWLLIAGDDTLLFLDPHTTQPAAPPGQLLHVSGSCHVLMTDLLVRGAQPHVLLQRRSVTVPGQS